MIWTADYIVHDGLAHKAMGLRVAPTGRITCLAPLHSLPRPDVTLQGQAIFSGRIDPYHHSLGSLSRAISATQAAHKRVTELVTDGTTGERWVADLSADALYIAAKAAFIRLLRCGITCVGEVHSLRYRADGALHTPRLAMLEALMAAAQDTGIRLALIDNVRLRRPAFGAPEQPACQSAPHFEVGCSDFDAAVTCVMDRRDPKLTWALGAHSLSSVPYDAMISLRTRLGHMPFFLGYPLSAPQALQELVQRDAIDACVTLATSVMLTTSEIVSLQQCGAVVCLCVKANGDLVQTPQALFAKGRVSAPILASGGADPAALSQGYADWPDAFALKEHLEPYDVYTVSHLAAEMNTTAARSLGVFSGAFRPGRWADFFAIDMPLKKELVPPQQLQPPLEAAFVAERLWRHLMAGPAESVVRHVVVGGMHVVQDFEHALGGPSYAAIQKLAAGLAKRN